MSQPMSVYQGKVPNPHILYGQFDMETAPTTFARIATRWGDLQLSNGVGSTNFGRRFTYSNVGYLANVMPTIPGQSRLSGTTPNSYPARGTAPSQWQFHVDNGPGSQPNYPGGPGYVMGQISHVGSSGS